MKEEKGHSTFDILYAAGGIFTGEFSVITSGKL